MKPKIFRVSDGTWRVRWRSPWESGLDYWERRCMTWRIAVEQLDRLYAIGDIGLPEVPR